MSKTIEASIVVVDDEPSIRDLLVASLHFAGFEVNTAASGSEAIEVIEKVHPDLSVLDVVIRDIGRFTVTRRIRQEGIDAPVLFLTARDDTQDKVMGLTVGGDDYVTKPFSLEDNEGRVLSKTQILDHVWQYDWGGDAAIVESYISYLRKKVDGVMVEDENGNKHKVTPLIETKRGIGYMIRAPKAPSKKDA